MFLNQVQYAKKIGMSKQYVNKMVKLGVIPLHNKKINPDEADRCLEEHKNPAYDAQREANEKTRDNDSVFHESNMPKESLADLSEDEMKAYNKSIEDKLAALENISTEEENASRPGKDSNASVWNTFKIMQQGLNYEIDRKVKERSLMPVTEFKAAAEIILSPMNQGLEDLAFSFKSKFPDVSDEKIQWLLDRTNELKVDVQNVSI